MNYINCPALYSYLFSYMSSVLIGKTAWHVVLRKDVAAEDVPEVCAAEVLHEVSDEGDGGVDVNGPAEVVMAVHVAARLFITR